MGLSVISGVYQSAALTSTIPEDGHVEMIPHIISYYDKIAIKPYELENVEVSSVGPTSRVLGVVVMRLP